MEKETSVPRVRKSRTAHFRRQMLSEHLHRYSVDGINESLLTQPVSAHSVLSARAHGHYRPLCLKQVIRELHQNFIVTHKLILQTSENSFDTSKHYSRSLPNISDVRLTEVALQNATAYKQNNQLLKQCSPTSSLEKILKEKLNQSRRRWRHYTEPGKYNKMWQSLGRDVQELHGSKMGDREKALGSRGQTTHISGREKEQQTEVKVKDNSKENRSSTRLSNPRKNSKAGWRYRSPRNVLPRIILPD